MELPQKATEEIEKILKKGNTVELKKKKVTLSSWRYNVKPNTSQYCRYA